MMTKNVLAGSAVVAVAAAGCLALSVQVPASAVPGTWSRVTSPSDGTSILRQSGHEGQMTVKGAASADVTAVNVYCMVGSGSGVDATTVATSVPVTNGAFQAIVPVPSEPTYSQCRFRALPSGVNPQTSYLASYAGPVVNLDFWRYFPSADDYLLQASTQGGSLVAHGLGTCSSAFLGTVMNDQTVPGGSDGCLLGLGSAEFPAATHSTVRVDGHEAFTTTAAKGYGLTPTQPASASFRLWRGSGVRWTEVMPVDRCAADVAFPPNAGSCPTLVASGVEIHQVSTYLPEGNQVRIRTEFRSVDGNRHRLRLDYLRHMSPPARGQLGFRFPGQKGFRASSTGEAISALGAGSGAMLVRSDRFSDEGDPAAATRAITWSRTPSSITFSPLDAATFHTAYRLTVPKGGSVHLGFADSSGIRTSRALALSRRAEADMMPAPRITSPAPGALIKGRTTTVKGVVRAGADGLPTSVTVNGHRARLTPTSSSTAIFTVTFLESVGRHTVKAVARDAGGITRTASVQVRNTPA